MQTKPRSPKKVSTPEASIVSGGSNPSGVIYVDQDSDITSIVTKLRSEEAKSVKIVVPKNSTALNSGVNLKLLARTAHSKSKNLALITSDSKLVAMAAAAKIPTAPNLSAEPNIKAAAIAGGTMAATTAAIKINNPEDGQMSDEELDPSQAQPGEDIDEDLTIDDADLAATTTESELEPDTKSKKPKAEKGKRVPNFYDFRKKALIGMGAFLGVLLLVLLLMTTKKSAIINVKANAERVDVNFSAKLNENATETTKDELKVVKKSGSKTTTETTPATGQQDIGAKASGTLTITNCYKSASNVTISAGTIVSSGSLNYVTDKTVSIPPSDFTGGVTCKKNGTATVAITAQNAGTQYNSGAKSMSISGAPSGVIGSSSEIAGGTTQIVKVVSQADVATLREKLATNNQDAYKAELTSQFNSSQEPLEETFTVQLGDVQVTPAVGQQAETVAGTVVANYSMYGVEKSELEKILELNINELKKDESQSIVKNGVDELKISSNENGEYTFTTVAYIGPNIDTEKIKEETTGKKKGEAIQIVKDMDGVDSASVKISPFWATTLPKADKIQVKIEIADGSKDQ